MRSYEANIKMLKEREHERIMFISLRDGRGESIKWALKTLRIYRSAVLKNGQFGRARHFASTPGHKLGFMCSYLSMKSYYFSERVDGNEL